MADWTPITRGDPEVHGVDREFPGLLSISVKLSAVPPRPWIDHFIFATTVLSMHPPRLSSDTVWLRPPDAEVEQYMANLDQRIAAANQQFEANDLPRIRAEEARKQQQQDENQRRVREAQERLRRPE